jgi:hypothetical protein
MCYISSTEGTAFETNESGYTTLTASVLRGGAEVTDNTWTFNWFYEDNQTTDAPLKDINNNNAIGKEVRINKSALRGRRIYFTAEKANNS